MKKILAVLIMVIILTMGIIAQAEEAYVKAWRITLDKAGRYVYHVTYLTSSGTSKEFEVSESEFNLAVEELAKIKNAEQKKAEKEAKKAEKKGGLFGTGLFAKENNEN